MENGLGTWCPPDGCYWYYIVVTTSGKVVIINSISLLQRVAPVVKTEQDAIIYVSHVSLSGSLYRPDPARQTAGMALKTEDGFLVVVNKRTNGCPETYAIVLFRMTTMCKAEKLGERTTFSSTWCI